MPVTALLLQGLVTSAIILSGRIDQIMQYAGFTLTLFASLAVSCVIALRIRRPEMRRPFRCWGYPWTPLFFLAVSGWMMFWAVRGRPVESLLSLLDGGRGRAALLPHAGRAAGCGFARAGVSRLQISWPANSLALRTKTVVLRPAASSCIRCAYSASLPGGGSCSPRKTTSALAL